MPKTDQRDPGGPILFLVSTPIGNLEDITLRALRVFKEVDLIAAEDTRTARKLLARFSIKKPLVSYYDACEKSRSEEIISHLSAGRRVALVSEAGTPGLSDPGWRLIRKAIAAGVRVVPVPGPSAILGALVVSGLPTHSFVFEGFLPPRAGARKKKLISLREEERTMIFFESTRRVVRTLAEIRELWGERNVVLARELTKIHETVIRGIISEVLKLLGDTPLKGEVVLVIEGGSGRRKSRKPLSAVEIDSLRRRLNLSRMEAIKLAAELSGRIKREVYREYHRTK